MIKKLLPIIFLTFVNTIGFTLFLPILPFIVNKLGGGDFIYAITLSAYSICMFFAAPLMGGLSDIYGRRRLLLVSHLGTLLSWVIVGLSYFLYGKTGSILGLGVSLWVLMFARVLDGITGGNVSVAGAYVSDVTSKSERNKAYGLTGAATGLGFVLGPVIGSFSYHLGFGYLGTTIVAFLISLVTLFFIFFGIKETVVYSPNNNLSIKDSILDSFSFIKRIKLFSTNTHLLSLFKVKFIFSIVFVSYVSTLVLYLKNSAEFNERQTGLFFSLLGLFLIVNQGFIVPVLSKKFGEVNTLVYSQILMAITFIGFFLSQQPFAIIISMYFGNIAIGVNMINVRTLLTKNVSSKEQGAILGVDESIMSISSAFIPLLSSALFILVGNYFYLGLSLFSIFSFFIIRNINKE